MGLDRESKKTIVKEVHKKLETAQAVVLAEYRGVEVQGMTELRAKARQEGVYLKVMKNTLARRAVKDTPFESLTEHMHGPIAYGISEDPVSVAKVLTDFSKSNDKFVLKVGAMTNQVMSPKDLLDLAKLPSRDELLSKLMGTLQGPIGTLVRVMNEVPNKFVRTLAAVRDGKEQGS